MTKFLQIKWVLYFLLQSLFDFNAQNETQKWYFGNSAGLDFATSPPTILTNGAISTGAPCSSMSDAAGNLLFYTNGLVVYDKTHTQMANGSGLLGLMNPVQGNVIIKQPGSNSLFYIFTACGNLNPTGVNYTTVDMSLSAGAGSVTVKNTPLYPSVSTGYMAAVRHGNGTDTWVVIHQRGNNNFRAYLVSAAGVNTTAVISAIGSAHTGSIISGYLKFSPNGKKAGISLAPNLPNTSCFEVFDFNNQTGVLSNSVSVSSNFPIAFGCEFSPDGSKFYGTQGHSQIIPTNRNRIIQWDLCAGSNSAIAASEYTVATLLNLPPLGIQMAMDGKIYIAKGGQTSLGVINNPNALGSACNYIDSGQSIGTATCGYYLPNFASGYFCIPTPGGLVPPFTENIHNCGKITFTAPSISPVCTATGNTTAGLIWYFGDPNSGVANTSTVTSPVHFFSAPGTYSIQLVLKNSCKHDTTIKVLNINEATPSLTVSPSATICSGETLVLTASGADSYTWSEGTFLDSTVVMPTSTTVYTLTGISGTCSAQKEVTVVVGSCLSVSHRNSLPGLRIYPNPANSLLTIEGNQSSTFRILSGQGKVLSEGHCEPGINTIAIDALPAGIYLLEVHSNNCNLVFRIVKAQ